MSFQAPIWLILTPLIGLLFGGLLVYGFQRRDALLGRFAASRLLDQLTEQASRPRTWIKAACILVAVAAICLALARPQYGVEWSERKARGLDIVFVLDSSKSMLATDLRPTRLERAKLAVIDLVERLESDRIGLIAFAGQAFLQTPPTLDYAAFRESLDAVDPTIMTSGGSDLGNALKEASEAFPSENNVKVVILLTDGEDLGGNAIEAARSAQEAGIQVFAIGIGTPEGDYLKIRNAEGIEEFVRDAEGQPVLSKLDEPTLQQIAQITGGSYSRLSRESLDRLYSSVISTLPREERESELQEIRIERFQWALSAALLFLIMETLIRRRRSNAIQTGLVILTALTLAPPELRAQEAPEPQEPPAEHADARSLYNSAYESLSAGQYDAANELYERALSQTTDLSLQRDALYNMGHATYQQGRKTYENGDPQGALDQVKKAEQHFQSAQEIGPSDPSIQQDLEQVTRVREAIERFIEEQEKQNQEQKQQPQDSEDSEDSESSESEDSEQPQDEGDSQQNESDSKQNQDGSESEDEQNAEESPSGEEGENSEQDQQGQQGQQDQQGQEGQQGQQDQQGQEGEQESQGQNDQPSPDPSSESDPAGDENETDGEEASGQQPEAAPQESTQDPVDDIPQPQPGEENDETGESSALPEPTENASGEEGSAPAGGGSGQIIEGMSEAEAGALLDSLRSKETLLPFIYQQRSGRQGDTRDW